MDKTSMPKMLELFCGTKSVGKVFQQKYDVVSLDFIPKFNPTICEDILTWDYKKDYKEGDFEVIWASPDCRSWSVAGGGRHRVKIDMKPKTETAVLGEKLIHKTLEIIEYFKPKVWYIENPRGLLQYFPPMKTLGKTLVYYGNYKHNGENYAMVKPTHFWSNIPLWEDEKKPIMEADTYTIKYHNHDGRLKRFYKQYEKGAKEKSVIPSELIERVFRNNEYFLSNTIL